MAGFCKDQSVAVLLKFLSIPLNNLVKTALGVIKLYPHMFIPHKCARNCLQLGVCVSLTVLSNDTFMNFH